MRNDTIPKGIQKWLDDNADKVDEYHMERDCFRDIRNSQWAIWVYLKPGWWCRWMEGHIIHEGTQKDFLAYAATVEPCDCDRCKEEM